MIVRLSAITIATLLASFSQSDSSNLSPISSRQTHPSHKPTVSRKEEKGLTNKRQPDELKLYQRNYAESYPQEWLGVDGQPEETTIRRIDLLDGRIARLKNPMGVTALSINFVPPPQPNESSAGNVFQVVEVDGEEDDCDDEDHDTAARKGTS